MKKRLIMLNMIKIFTGLITVCVMKKNCHKLCRLAQLQMVITYLMNFISQLSFIRNISRQSTMQIINPFSWIKISEKCRKQMILKNLMSFQPKLDKWISKSLLMNNYSINWIKEAIQCWAKAEIKIIYIIQWS